MAFDCIFGHSGNHRQNSSECGQCACEIKRRAAANRLPETASVEFIKLPRRAGRSMGRAEQSEMLLAFGSSPLPAVAPPRSSHPWAYFGHPVA